MASFRFLHAADVHLDSPLRGLSRYEGVPADEVRTATRTAFNRLVRLAIDRDVAFVVIAGDLFDGEPRDVGTRHAVAAGFGELGRAGIPVYALAGNHDAASTVRDTLPAMAHVHWFDTRKPGTLVDARSGVALHGQGFARRDVTMNLAAGYPAAHPDHFNIGVLHTSLTGYDGHETYAPCALPELLAKGYGYWALGHVHGHDVVHADPPVVFSGCLQGRSIREVGAKGAVLVEVEDGQVANLAHLPLDVVRWAEVRVDATGAADLAAVETRLLTGLDRGVADADGRPLLVRIHIAGTLDGPLNDAVHDWAGRRDELRVMAAGVARDLWIEKVVIRTVAAAAPQPRDTTNVVDLLGALDETLHARLQADLAPFLARQTDGMEAVMAAKAGDWTDLVARAAAALRARLGTAV